MLKDVADLNNLIGATILDVTKDGIGMLDIKTDKGDMVFYHYQDCCEYVWLDDGYEELKAMIGEKIVFAEEIRSSDRGDHKPYVSCTWTFYKISTQWKDVTLRFIGESNGYYSESVDLRWEGR